MAEEKCNDKKCYKHGGVKVRGERLNGRIVSTKGKNTVIVERDTTTFFPKYNRRAKQKSHIAAHLPECIQVNMGDLVYLGETRKLSKTKAWTVLEIVKKSEER